jgi:hypothetical protein
MWQQELLRNYFLVLISFPAEEQTMKKWVDDKLKNVKKGAIFMLLNFEPRISIR